MNSLDNIILETKLSDMLFRELSPFINDDIDFKDFGDVCEGLARHITLELKEILA